MTDAASRWSATATSSRGTAAASCCSTPDGPSTSSCGDRRRRRSSRGRRSSRCRRWRMVEAGFAGRDASLALACGAATTARPMHVAGARATLAAAGLDESALQCPPDLPVRPRRAARLGRRRRRPGRDLPQLLGQARGDGRDLRGGRLAGRHLPSTRPTRCSRRSGPDRVAVRRAGVAAWRSTAAARRRSRCSLRGLARAFARAGDRAERRRRRWWPTRCARTRGWSAAPGGR